MTDKDETPPLSSPPVAVKPGGETLSSKSAAYDAAVESLKTAPPSDLAAARDAYVRAKEDLQRASEEPPAAVAAQRRLEQALKTLEAAPDDVQLQLARDEVVAAHDALQALASVAT